MKLDTYTQIGLPEDVSKERLHKIQEYFAEQGYPVEVLRKKNRKKEVVFARYLYIYNLKKHIKLNHCSIAEHLNSDHSTITYAFKKIQEWEEYDPEYSRIIKKINKQINGIIKNEVEGERYRRILAEAHDKGLQEPREKVSRWWISSHRREMKLAYYGTCLEEYIRFMIESAEESL